MAKKSKNEALAMVACAKVAAGLREFGYPDVTAVMVRECAQAVLRGDEKIPHGVIGIFVKKGMDEAAKGKHA